jgi:RNA polymerase sigma factor (sigma-70 family)
MLELLAKQHDDWIRIAFSMTDDMDEAKDLVQDMYLVVIEGTRSVGDITYKDQINRYFVWKLLRSLFVDRYRRKNSKKNIVTWELRDEDNAIESIDYDYSEDECFSSILDKVKDITSDWKPYDKKLFDLYFMQGLSLRKIAKGAGIGLNSIHNSVKSYREVLREELSEDLMDYFNGDYDKID